MAINSCWTIILKYLHHGTVCIVLYRIQFVQERQIVTRYARLTPSCKAGACTKQNSSMKNNKGH